MEGWLNDHIQLQPLVDVSADGNTARVRSRELSMTGKIGGQGLWSEGVYENTFVRDRRRVEDQVAALLSDLHHGLRQGLGERRAARAGRQHAASARSAADGNVRDLPEAARAAVPLSQSGHRQGADVSAPKPMAARRKQLAAAALMPTNVRYAPPKVTDVDATVTEASSVLVERVKDFHALDNLRERLRLLPRQEPLERPCGPVLA